MPDPHLPAVYQDTHDVEPIGLEAAPMPGDPDPCRPTQLPLLSPIHRFHRVAKPGASPSFDFDEGDESVAFDHKVDVPMPAPKPALHDPPAPLPEPSLRNALSELAECLPGR